MKKGFSLFEMIVALGLFSILATTSIVMLLSTLQSARKAAAIGVVKNEGQYAMTGITQMVRFAKSITCPSQSQLSITRTNGDVVDYSLAGTAIASEGASLTSSRLTVSQCGGGMFTCAADGRSVRICFVADNAAAGGQVTDTGGVTFDAQVALRNYGN